MRFFSKESRVGTELLVFGAGRRHQHRMQTHAGGADHVPKYRLRRGVVALYRQNWTRACAAVHAKHSRRVPSSDRFPRRQATYPDAGGGSKPVEAAQVRAECMRSTFSRAPSSAERLATIWGIRRREPGWERLLPRSIRIRTVLASERATNSHIQGIAWRGPPSHVGEGSRNRRRVKQSALVRGHSSTRLVDAREIETVASAIRAPALRRVFGVGEREGCGRRQRSRTPRPPRPARRGAAHGSRTSTVVCGEIPAR